MDLSACMCQEAISEGAVRGLGCTMRNAMPELLAHCSSLNRMYRAAVRNLFAGVCLH